MTIFGFLATIVVCVTAVVIVSILLRHPLHTHVHTHLHTENTETQPKEVPAEEKPVPEDTELKQMDAVIAAVNELMGIETEDKNGSTQA